MGTLERGLRLFHFDFKLSSWVLSSLSLDRRKTLLARHPLMGTKTIPSSSKNCPEPASAPPMIDSRSDLTFTAYLHVPPTFGRKFPYTNLKLLLSLWSQSLRGESRDLLCTGLTERDSFPVSPPPLPPPLDLVTKERPNLVCSRPSG